MSTCICRFLSGLTTFALVIGASNVRAQTLHIVPPLPGDGAGLIRSLNDNGTVAAGASLQNPMIWTVAGGSQALGHPIGLLSGAACQGISIDASGTSVLVSCFANASSPLNRSYVWTANSGHRPLVLSPNGTLSYGIAISPDGLTVVGSQNQSFASLWQVGTAGNFPAIPAWGSGYRLAFAVNQDGTVVALYGSNQAHRWTAATGAVPLGSFPNMAAATPRSMSLNGDVIVGDWQEWVQSTPFTQDRGFIWTVADGMTALPLTAAGDALKPFDVSGDGQIVVGTCMDAAAGEDGMIWTATLGSVPLTQYLQARGVPIVGFDIAVASTISHDGSTIGGWGHVPTGAMRGFVLTGLDCPYDASWSFSPSTSICPAETIILTSTASGLGTLHYQWFRNGIPLVDGPRTSGAVIAGAASAQMTITGYTAAESGSYHVRIQSTAGCSQVLAAQTVPPPAQIVITQNPTSVLACVGDQTSFSVAAVSGIGSIVYQWQQLLGSTWLNVTDGLTVSGAVVSGSNTPTLTVQGVQSTDAGEFRCVLLESACDTLTAVNSGSALLTVFSGLSSATITQQPVSVTICEGPTSAATFSTVVSPTTGITYQWQRRVLSSFVNLVDGPTTNGPVFAGTQTSTLTITGVSLADQTRYRCVIGQQCGPTLAITQNAQLFVETTPSIAIQPISMTACGGTATLNVTPTTAATGPLSFQWYRSPGTASPSLPIPAGVLSTGAFASGPQTSTLTITSFGSADVGDYHVAITGNCGSVQSLVVRVSFCPVDFNCDGAIEVSDVFAFLAAYFANCAAIGPAPCQYGSGDFNGDGELEVSDIFAFLAAYFSGSCS